MNGYELASGNGYSRARQHRRHLAYAQGSRVTVSTTPRFVLFRSRNTRNCPEHVQIFNLPYTTTTTTSLNFVTFSENVDKTRNDNAVTRCSADYIFGFVRVSNNFENVERFNHRKHYSIHPNMTQECLRWRFICGRFGRSDFCAKCAPFGSREVGARPRENHTSCITECIRSILYYQSYCQNVPVCYDIF